MKRLLWIGTLVICLVCILGLAVYATPEDRGYTPLEQAIYDGLYDHSVFLDLSGFEPTSEELSAAFQHVYYTSAELFYVEIDEVYEITKNGAGRVVRFQPVYNDMTAEEIVEASVVLTDTIDRIVAGVKSTWSDLEKALYVHDYLALYYDYDQGLTIRDAYTFFTEGKGVCVSYAIAYCAAMEELGIPVDVVTSTDLKHIWNVVQVDGLWYHVDVTFDDPVALDEIGCVSHEFFLKSTASFLSVADHYATDWVMDVTCSSTAYDNAFWNTIESPFCNVGDVWYYIDGVENYQTTAIYAYHFDTGVATPVKSLNSRWKVNAMSYYNYSFSKLGMYKDKLYYNTPNTIMMYDPANNTESQVYQLVGTQVGSIYNFMVRDNVAYYVTNTQATDSTHPVKGSYSRTLVNRYTVQFLDGENGNVLFSTIVDEGATVTPPDYTQKVADHKIYPFAGWQGYTDGMAITQNQTFIATYDMDNVTDVLYTYTFYAEDGTTVLLQGSAPYGTVLTPPAPPTKQADSLWRYTFAGWQGYTDGMTLAGNVTFTAQFTKQSIVTVVPPATSSTPSASTPSSSTPAISGTGEPSVSSNIPSNTGANANAADPSAPATDLLLDSPVIFVAIGVVVLAILTPTILIATERGRKKSEKKQTKKDDWDRW